MFARTHTHTHTHTPLLCSGGPARGLSSPEHGSTRLCHEGTEVMQTTSDYLRAVWIRSVKAPRGNQKYIQSLRFYLELIMLRLCCKRKSATRCANIKGFATYSKKRRCNKHEHEHVCVCVIVRVCRVAAARPASWLTPKHNLDVFVSCWWPSVCLIYSVI